MRGAVLLRTLFGMYEPVWTQPTVMNLGWAYLKPALAVSVDEGARFVVPKDQPHAPGFLVCDRSPDGLPGQDALSFDDLVRYVLAGYPSDYANGFVLLGVDGFERVDVRDGCWVIPADPGETIRLDTVVGKGLRGDDGAWQIQPPVLRVEQPW